ncbi:MAG TPA: hypothetical protein VLI41_08825 [Phenylobacterium sp.]|uniref:hypothetical protein n=1 Tax=Phenylobacterium sp. TaxID=1871053 RepID=UPI002CE801D8|nr:hypothetical protein [Phenylobacterium sp.]HSV03296.1 hypothetical protein [Phenylobacterium sp.]
MTTDAYSDGTTPHSRREAGREADRAQEARRGYGDVGAQIFLWLAWALAFAFWVFSMTIDAGILHALAQGGHNTLMGGLDSSGAGFFLIGVFGFIVLGIAIAYGAARWATRDKRLDPVTEAATAEIYDDAERGVRPYGAPGTRGDEEGGAYRPV